jgi:hypothetical protein
MMGLLHVNSPKNKKQLKLIKAGYPAFFYGLD